MDIKNIGDVTMPKEMAILLAKLLYLTETLCNEIMRLQYDVTFDARREISAEEKDFIGKIAGSTVEALKKKLMPRMEEILGTANTIKMMRPHDVEQKIVQ